MIRRVTLTDYGPFASADLVMEPLTVIVGPNASGKSKLLEFLHALCGDRGEGLSAFLEKMARRGATNRPSFDPPELTSDYPGKTRSLLLKLDPDTLRLPSYIQSTEPLMREDGYGLATNLAYLKLNDIDSFNRLVKNTREIVPAFEGLRFKRVPIHQNEAEIFGDELVFDMKKAPDLAPDAVSDGTLLTLGLLTCAMENLRRQSTDNANSILLLFLIDDLERGLHPRAMAELVAQLRRLTESPGVQILATSHSPYLLDALKPEEVRLTGFLDDGSATIRPLTAHPDFERWKDEMTPGEIWSLVGEDWIK